MIVATFLLDCQLQLLVVLHHVVRFYLVQIDLKMLFYYETVSFIQLQLVIRDNHAYIK